jgi:hypothetical protein
MSKRVEASIQCPNCGHHQNAVLFRSIWAEFEENRSLILNDQVNIFLCDICKYSERLAFPFLCTNVKKQIAIWYEPHHDAQVDADVKQYAAHMGPNSFYAKAPRIADWQEFKARFLEMEAAGPQPGQQPRRSAKIEKLFQGFIDSLKGAKPNRKALSEEPQQSVGDVMEAYGRLLQKYPLSIIDVSMLPLPKAKMKIVLKALYAEAASLEQQSFLEAGFMFLSNFQDGLGATPIDGKLLRGDPKETLEANKAILDKLLPWQKLSNAEAQILSAEWTRFKEGEPI